MVKNIKAGGNVCDNQINDFSESVIHGDVLIGSMSKPKKLSDCKKQEVPEKTLRDSILAEVIAGAISLLISVAFGFLNKVVSLEQNSALLVAAIGLLAALIALVLLFSGFNKFISFRKLKSSSEFIEMPSTALLIAEVLNRFSNENILQEHQYIRHGKFYRKENELIFEYIDAGDCDACEDGLKGTLKIRKTGNKEYECVCTRNPKHIFDFDFTKK